MTEVLLPRNARQGTVCLVPIRGQAGKARIEKFDLFLSLSLSLSPSPSTSPPYSSLYFPPEGFQAHHPIILYIFLFSYPTSASSYIFQAHHPISSNYIFLFSLSFQAHHPPFRGARGDRAPLRGRGDPGHRISYYVTYIYIYIYT